MERYNVSKFRGGDPQSSNLYNGPRLNVREANGNFVPGGVLEEHSNVCLTVYRW